MTRKKIRDIRHEEFIVAALEATHKRGFHAVTMSEIAAEIGATAASINYYFGSKDQLMFETMRHLLRILGATHKQYLDVALDPKDRLRAIFDAHFDPRFFTPQHCSFWVQFWSAAPYSAHLERLHRINQSRVKSHFRAELAPLVPAPFRETMRRILQSYLDGVWLSVAQADRGIDPRHARQEAGALIELVLSAEVGGSN
ncbi:MAG: transcriptional regulator BetI [Paracoccaceae bacterium]|jgi:TetR/AcrR family transcriptional repressor of bet genes|nr:transcriptional regulator BetI [Paracoccaceae bacterium]